MNSVNINEIFCSLQGEGRYAGTSTIFVRFSGCNLRCRYCDTKKALSSSKFCKYEKLPFSGQFIKIKNNLTAQQIALLIKSIKTTTRMISFTGGEPLLFPEVIKELISLLGPKYTYLLETNGTLYKNLKVLKNAIDIFSIDIKRGQEKNNIKFCKLLKNKNKYLKIVLEDKLNPEILVKTIKSCDCQEVYLQPEYGKKINNKKLEKLIYLLAKEKINFKYLPQLHKILKIK